MADYRGEKMNLSNLKIDKELKKACIEHFRSDSVLKLSRLGAKKFTNHEAIAR